MENVAIVNLTDFPSRTFVPEYKLLVQFLRNLELDSRAFYEDAKQDVIKDSGGFGVRVARINYKLTKHYFFEINLNWARAHEPVINCRCSPMAEGGSTVGSFRCSDVEHVKAHLHSWAKTLEWYETEQSELEGYKTKSFGEAFFEQFEGRESEVDATTLGSEEQQKWQLLLTHSQEVLKDIQELPNEDKAELLEFIEKSKNNAARVAKGAVSKKWAWFKAKVSIHGPKVVKAFTDEMLKRTTKLVFDHGTDFIQKAIENIPN